MPDFILQFDNWLFHLLNSSWSSSFQDWLLPPLRDKYFWIPAYLLLAGWLVFRFRRNGLFALLLLILCVGLSDTLSHRVIKKAVQRPRPCQTFDPPQIRELVSCGSGYSFTSNHAANHFSLATCLFLLTGLIWSRWRWLLFLWAGLIAYAQIYVGVHYPLDILGGALLGVLCGWGCWMGFKKLGFRSLLGSVDGSQANGRA